MKKFLRPLVAVVMAVTFMVAYLTSFAHVITFHEQHHLFVFTADYFSSTAHQHGFLWPLMEFVVQFGYYPWLGALVWTAILTSTYLMTQSIIRRLTGWRDLLQLSAILPCWMFFRTVDIDNPPLAPVGVFLGVAALWVVALIASRFYRPRLRGEEGGKWWWLIAGPALFAAFFSFFNYRFTGERTATLPSGVQKTFTREEVKKQRRAEELMIKADQAVRGKDWPRVQQLAEEALAGGARNHLMDYFRAMALYHQGTLVDHLFDSPQRFGVRSLFFPWKADKNQAEYGGYLYEQLGALNTATHWEFEAMVGWGETASHLTNLSRYYIATGKPAQARKFIYPLSRTLFYRSTARQLEHDLEQGSVPGLRDSHASTPVKHGRWDSTDDLCSDLAFLLSFDCDNVMAQQYLLLGLLLQNNVGAFYANLTTIYPDGCESLPELYQQALCLARMGLGEERLRADGFVISPKVEQELQEYMSEYGKGQMANFSPQLRRTYWYYIHHYSPEGQQVNV